jgi:hypothetical protein
MTNLKEEISNYGNTFSTFFTDNKVLVAALAGLAAGVALASILGSDKAKTAFNSLSDTASDLKDKAIDAWDSNKEIVAETAKKVAGKARQKAPVE